MGSLPPNQRPSLCYTSVAYSFANIHRILQTKKDASEMPTCTREALPQLTPSFFILFIYLQAIAPGSVLSTTRNLQYINWPSDRSSQKTKLESSTVANHGHGIPLSTERRCDRFTRARLGFLILHNPEYDQLNGHLKRSADMLR